MRNTALGMLARRDHSTEEVRRKLKDKCQASSEEAQEVIDYLYEYKYLDDKRFASAYCRYRINKGFGPERILRDLDEKGVDRAIANAEVDAIDDWQAIALSVKNKKFKSPPEDFKQKAKQIQFLRYRGFRFDDIAFLCES